MNLIQEEYIYTQIVKKMVHSTQDGHRTQDRVQLRTDLGEKINQIFSAFSQ